MFAPVGVVRRGLKEMQGCLLTLGFLFAVASASGSKCNHDKTLRCSRLMDRTRCSTNFRKGLSSVYTPGVDFCAAKMPSLPSYSDDTLLGEYAAPTTEPEPDPDPFVRLRQHIETEPPGPTTLVFQAVLELADRMNALGQDTMTKFEALGQKWSELLDTLSELENSARACEDEQVPQRVGALEKRVDASKVEDVKVQMSILEERVSGWKDDGVAKRIMALERKIEAYTQEKSLPRDGYGEGMGIGARELKRLEDVVKDLTAQAHRQGATFAPDAGDPRSAQRTAVDLLAKLRTGESLDKATADQLRNALTPSEPDRRPTKGTTPAAPATPKRRRGPARARASSSDTDSDSDDSGSAAQTRRSRKRTRARAFPAPPPPRRAPARRAPRATSPSPESVSDTPSPSCSEASRGRGGGAQKSVRAERKSPRKGRQRKFAEGLVEWTGVGDIW